MHDIEPKLFELKLSRAMKLNLASIMIWLSILASVCTAQDTNNISKISPSALPDSSRLIAINGVNDLFQVPSVKERVTATYSNVMQMVDVTLETSVLYQVTNHQIISYNPVADIVMFMDAAPAAQLSFGILTGPQLLRLLKIEDEKGEAPTDRITRRLALVRQVVATVPKEDYSVLFGSQAHEPGDEREIAMRFASFLTLLSQNMSNKCSDFAQKYMANASFSEAERAGLQYADMDELGLLLWLGDDKKPVFVYSDKTGLGYWLLLSVLNDEKGCSPKGILVLRDK